MTVKPWSIRRRAIREPMLPIPTNPSLIEFDIGFMVTSCSSTLYCALALPKGNSANRADQSRCECLRCSAFNFNQGFKLRQLLADIGSLVPLHIPHKLDAIVVFKLVVRPIKDVLGLYPCFRCIERGIFGNVNKRVAQYSSWIDQ